MIPGDEEPPSMFPPARDGHSGSESRRGSAGLGLTSRIRAGSRKYSGQVAFSTILSIGDRNLTSDQRAPASSSSSLSSSSSTLEISHFSSTNAMQRQMQRQRHARQRANTTNSLFTLRSTMESTPTEVAIQCVSHVILHFLTRARKFLRRNPSWKPKERWLVFNDDTEHRTTVALDRVGGLSVFRDGGDPRLNGTSTVHADRGVSFDFDFEILPTTMDIIQFLRTAYETAQLEIDSLICALILLERLLEKGVRHGGLVITSQNWRTILFTCLVLASKLCDDFTMWSSDFCRILGVSIKRMNQLEMRLLEALQYDVTVHASEFAQFHFQLRSLAYHLNLEGNDLDLAFGHEGKTGEDGSGKFAHPIRADAARKLSGLAARFKERKKNANSPDSTLPSSGLTSGSKGRILTGTLKYSNDGAMAAARSEHQSPVAPVREPSAGSTGRTSDNSTGSPQTVAKWRPKLATTNRQRSESALPMAAGMTEQMKGKKGKAEFLSIDDLMIAGP